jgi:uncharacterized protein (TIGR02466 family)
MIHQMFSVPIGIFDNGNDALNHGLLEAIMNNPTQKAGADLFQSAHPALQELKALFLAAATQMLNERFIGFAPTIKNGWANQHPHSSINPHAHPHSILAGTYYPHVPPGSGDLLLQDPNAGSMWANYTDDPYEYMVYQRIAPKAGRMVLFPAHIVHSVQPSQPGADRMSIAVNFGVEKVSAVGSRRHSSFANSEEDTVVIDRACFDRGCACFNPSIDKDFVIVGKV